MSLRFCPPEIQSYIFELACLDDGQTARSLCLTSHYFREIAESYLLQSLAISGPNMIKTLASRLERTPFYQRQIRHLFISDQPLSKSQPRKSVPAPSGTREATDLNSLMQIITLAAPTLESLTFICSTPHISTIAISRLFRTAFPRLCSLTVSGFYSFPTTPSKFPLLERLHLHGNRNPHGLLQVGALEEACPRLEDLQVSGLNMAVSFAMEVKEALALKKAVKPDEARDQVLSLFPSRLPTTLKRLQLQPGPDMSSKSSIYAIKDGLMMDALAAIESPSGLEVTLHPRADPAEMVESFRREWSL